MTEDRFWAKVRKAEGCWEWTASRTWRGYGRFWIGDREQAAHRFAYELLVGAIPHGLTLDHLCRNRGCVNPAHLEPVTTSENILRGVSPSALNARKTHCVRGHPLSGDNLYMYRGGRNCRACQTEREGRRNG